MTLAGETKLRVVTRKRNARNEIYLQASPNSLLQAQKTVQWNNEINYIRRHPKTCKYTTIYKYCKFDNCAYLHEHSGNNPTLKLLEKDKAELKSEIDELMVVNKSWIIVSRTLMSN